VADGERPNRHKRLDREREVVDYTFSVTIEVHGPPDVEARLRKLIDTELQRLYTAIQQKKTG
jgi:hypothetical protein